MKTFKSFIKEESSFSDKAVSIYPHGQGSDVGDHVPTSKPSSIPAGKSRGNEPFKDKKWFNSPEKREYMNKMQSDIKAGKKMPPVLSTPNPWNSQHHVVVDGNHRMHAHQQAGVSKIPARHISHDDVHIMPNNYGEENKGIPLSSFREKDGSYDMHKPRPELGGKALKHYFVRPNGEHNFRSPFEK